MNPTQEAAHCNHHSPDLHGEAGLKEKRQTTKRIHYNVQGGNHECKGRLGCRLKECF